MTREHFRAGAKAFARGEPRMLLQSDDPIRAAQDFYIGWDAAQDLKDVSESFLEVAKEKGAAK